MVGQDPWYIGSWTHQAPRRLHPAPESLKEMGWSCCQDAWQSSTETASLWWTMGRKAYSWRSKEEIWRLSQALAADLPVWRSAVLSGARLAESKRIQESKNKRAIRKVRAASAASKVPSHPCPTCGRFFKSRAGLSRHFPTHKPWIFCFNYWKSHSQCRIRKTNIHIYKLSYPMV